MKYSIRDIFEYIIALINEFAKRYSLTEKQAYRYIRAHKGIAFIEENYGAMHTLSFDDAVESVTLYCTSTRRNSNIPIGTSMFVVSLDGGHGCINDIDGIEKLLAYISEQNRLGKTNIQVRGFDFSSTDGTYFAFTCHTPQYDQTTIPDSLELYHDVHI